MDDESGKGSKEEVEVIHMKQELSSEDEESRSASLEGVYPGPAQSIKKTLYDQGLYSPDTADICNICMPMSDSAVFRHVYYNYPAISDPGIKDALLLPPPPAVRYSDDGQELYLHLCSEMNTCPVRIFHRNLLNSEIDLSYYCVNPRGVRAMAMALHENKIVTRLDLTDNFLNDDACYHLGHMLKFNITLKELILTGCRIGESGLLRLGINFNVNSSLVSLELARNDLGDEGGVVFGNIIASGISIKIVNLSKNKLGKNAALALAGGLALFNPLTHIDLSWNMFNHNPSVVKLLEQLADGQFLEGINLSFNSFEGTRVGGAIAKLLAVPTLRVLDLSNNRLEGATISLIGAGLLRADKLVTLDLSCNPMVPKDAYNILQRMLSQRAKLQNLLLNNVCVNKSFLVLVKRVGEMKSRKNFTVTYGDVLGNWTCLGTDARELILRRADYLGKSNKKNKLDVALYFLALNKQIRDPVPVKSLIDKINADKAPLNESIIDELCTSFPGENIGKERTVLISAICEYIARLWPDKQLPPTPQELEPAPAPAPPPKTKK